MLYAYSNSTEPENSLISITAVVSSGPTGVSYLTETTLALLIEGSRPDIVWSIETSVTFKNAGGEDALNAMIEFAGCVVSGSVISTQANTESSIPLSNWNSAREFLNVRTL